MKKRRFAEGGELPQAKMDRLATEENLADRELIMGPLRKAKNYVTDKIKGMDQRSLEQVAKDTLGKMDQRTLQNVTTDKMDQRSLEDVFKGKPPKYKEPVEKKAKGGKVSSASKRADGCCIRGKTRA
jgi:hypothetical protein